jgi:tyrosinase
VLTRKNQATLSADEKSRFVAAVLAIKAKPPVGLGKYDQYVNVHAMFMHYAHRGPAFFPWHREFLRRFELDLQSVDSNVTLPYWDWSVDNSTSSSIWNPDFMGGNGRTSDGKVMDGPFAYDAGNFRLKVIPDPPENTADYLRREFGTHAGSLPTPGSVGVARDVTPYDVPPWDDTSTSGFRNKLEGFLGGTQLHNLVHEWVGGSMRPRTSPNDPVFFLHHCFVDKLWAEWQAKFPDEGYRPSSGAHLGHNLNDLMPPWNNPFQPWNNVRPADVLDHHALGYRYDTEPIDADISAARMLLLE